MTQNVQKTIQLLAGDRLLVSDNKIQIQSIPGVPPITIKLRRSVKEKDIQAVYTTYMMGGQAIIRVVKAQEQMSELTVDSDGKIVEEDNEQGTIELSSPPTGEVRSDGR